MQGSDPQIPMVLRDPRAVNGASGHVQNRPPTNRGLENPGPYLRLRFLGVCGSAPQRQDVRNCTDNIGYARALGGAGCAAFCWDQAAQEGGCLRCSLCCSQGLVPSKPLFLRVRIESGFFPPRRKETTQTLHENRPTGPEPNRLRLGCV